MRDSDTYWAIYDEGRELEVKRAILELGKQRFGPPEEAIIEVLNTITDLERLERIIMRLFTARNWQDFLGTR